MLLIKTAKILSTRLYEFFEGGNIDTIATSPDKLVRRTNQATFSDLRKSGIRKAFGEFVVHTRTVAPQVLASVLPRRVETAASGFHLFTFVPSLLGMSALPPKADMCSALAYVCFGPIADIAPIRSPRRRGRAPTAAQ
jgi:hypothetical protein